MYSTTALQGGRQDFEIRWAKKKFPRRGFFPEIFLNFYIEILKYWGILSPKTSFEGQSRAFRTYIYYLYNFRGEAGQNIGGAMAPLAPPLPPSLPNIILCFKNHVYFHWMNEFNVFLFKIHRTFMNTITERVEEIK